MRLLDLFDLLSIPWLKPPRGKHWGWWVLWSLWTAFWLLIVALAGYLAVTLLLT